VTQALDNAKWTSWSGLGNMPPMEAMRLYVRTLEEDVVRRSSRVFARVPAPVHIQRPRNPVVVVAWAPQTPWSFPPVRCNRGVPPSAKSSPLASCQRASELADSHTALALDPPPPGLCSSLAAYSPRSRSGRAWRQRRRRRMGRRSPGPQPTARTTPPRQVITISMDLLIVENSRPDDHSKWSHCQHELRDFIYEITAKIVSRRQSSVPQLFLPASEEEAQRPRSLAEWCEAGSWTAPAVGGERRPLPRYDHAVAGVGMKMFVVGGNNGEGVAWR